MADITVTIPNSTFTIDTISNGIEVTTPTSVEVNVDSNSNTIDITNTPQEITVLTSGTLTVTTTGITSVNGFTGPIVVLDTDDITEGTNKYFSQALARASLSAGTGINYDSGTGVITNTSINTDTTYTQNISSTTGGANLNLVGSDSTTDTVKFANGTGVTVAYTDANTATISIGQSVATTDSVIFGSVNIDSRVVLDTVTLTTSATTADQVLDSFSSSIYRTAKYIVSVTSGSSYESVELLVLHDGTTAYQTTYAELRTSADLASFSVDVSGGNVRLLTTPANAVTVYKVTRTAIVV
jgi:hypothetical protein